MFVLVWNSSINMSFRYINYRATTLVFYFALLLNIFKIFLSISLPYLPPVNLCRKILKLLITSCTNGKERHDAIYIWSVDCLNVP